MKDGVKRREEQDEGKTDIRVDIESTDNNFRPFVYQKDDQLSLKKVMRPR